MTGVGHQNKLLTAGSSSLEVSSRKTFSLHKRISCIVTDTLTEAAVETTTDAYFVHALLLTFDDIEPFSLSQG